jgi:hypothetical protein
MSISLTPSAGEGEAVTVNGLDICAHPSQKHISTLGSQEIEDILDRLSLCAYSFRALLSGLHSDYSPCF